MSARVNNFYLCPSCHSPLGVEPSDAFLKAMVSETVFDGILTARRIKEENDILSPLKPFLDVTCEICGKPVTEWDEHNVKLAVEKHRWGHTACWNSGFGQLILISQILK